MYNENTLGSEFLLLQNNFKTLKYESFIQTRTVLNKETCKEVIRSTLDLYLMNRILPLA